MMEMNKQAGHFQNNIADRRLEVYVAITIGLCNVNNVLSVHTVHQQVSHQRGKRGSIWLKFEARANGYALQSP